MNKVDTLTLQLQMMTQERNELRGILANSTKKDLNNSILHNQLLSEQTQLKQKVSMLREENRKLWREQISLQESCEKVKNHCEEAYEKIYELCAEEKQHDLATVQDESLLQKDLLQQEPCVFQANEPPLTPVPCNLGILGHREKNRIPSPVSAEVDSISQECVGEDNALQRLQHPSPVLVIGSSIKKVFVDSPVSQPVLE
ncbi:hypothetical protein ACRRTK_008242 [Alexandromys fortis]